MWTWIKAMTWTHRPVPKKEKSTDTSSSSSEQVISKDDPC